MNPSKLRPAPSNFLASVKRMLDQYREGIFHGFQKDAIQNSLGARKNDNSFDGWKCDIYLQTTDKGTFLIVEDFGTFGLTGENMTYEEVQRHSQANDLSRDERLARIESVWNSGGNTGPGLFGIGKYVYSAMSEGEKPLYYFDSKTDDGAYRANANLCGQLQYPAEEGEAAEKLIKEDTGLDPISHVGTRFIIAHPKQEAIDDIKNGKMAGFAAETWWRLFSFFGENDGIFVQHQKIAVPAIYSLNITVPKNFWVNPREEQQKPGYRIKHFGFFILDEKIDEPRMRGIYFYRKGMRVFKIDCDLIPEDLFERCYGYIEVDDKWEKEMEKVEDITHYEISPSMHHSNQVIYLKDYVFNKVRELLIKWGYRNEKKGSSRFGDDFDDFVKNQVAEALEDLGYQPLGKGEEPDRVTLRLNNVSFPNPQEERTVYDNDVISFDYSLKNINSSESDFEITFRTICSELDKKEIASETRPLVAMPGMTALGRFSISVNPSNSEKNLANTLEITVRLKGR